MVNSCKKINLEAIQYVIDQTAELSDELPENLISHWFYSPKYSRLTDEGLIHFSKVFKQIVIELNTGGKTIKPNHMLSLSKNLTTPYHLRQYYLYIFDEEEAIELILLDGDLDQYVRIHKI